MHALINTTCRDSNIVYMVILAIAQLNRGFAFKPLLTQPSGKNLLQTTNTSKALKTRISIICTDNQITNCMPNCLLQSNINHWE